jgi:hypothetical protein
MEEFCMKKRLLVLGMAALALLSLSAFLGCSQDDDDESVDHTSLVNSVYGGENPMSAWVTVAFKADGKVICAFSGDNSTNEWNYTYYASSGAGDIINPSGGWTPGAFELNGDKKTMSFTNYGSHGPRDFKRLRAHDLTVDAVPFTPGTGVTVTNLDNSVWGGTTPQAGGTGWLTITLRNITTADTHFPATGLRAVLSFSADNTTNNWNWTDYNDSSRTGTIAKDGGGWTPGAFTISADGLTLAFSSYMGATREFKRYR